MERKERDRHAREESEERERVEERRKEDSRDESLRSVSLLKLVGEDDVSLHARTFKRVSKRTKISRRVSKTRAQTSFKPRRRILTILLWKYLACTPNPTLGLSVPSTTFKLSKTIPPVGAAR